MSLNAGIILQGQQAQPVNALAQGAQAGQMINDIRHQNAMRDMYQQHGAGIAQGDQNALNALSAFDPQAALSVQNTRQGMAARDQQMQMALRAEAREVQAMAASATAAERAALAEQVEASVAMGMQAQSPEQWDALMQERNPDLVGMFDQREMIAAEFMSVADSLKRADAANAPTDNDLPASIQALQFRAQQAGLQPGTPEYQQFMMSGGSGSGMSLEVGADGSISFSEGGALGGNSKDLTVDAAKNTGFLIRARESQAILNELEAEGTSLGARIRSSAPLGLGNYFQTAEYQRYDQAKRDMINAILRRESGAVISDTEFANADKQYFPQPGDSPEVIAQKRQNRENAIAGMAVGSGDGVNRIGDPADAGDAPDFATMSVEEIESWLAENGG